MPARRRNPPRKPSEQGEKAPRRRGRQARSPRTDVWDRPEPGARRAGHSRESIAAAAIAIGDAEGFKAISMRRVAAELGAGTMTLYHYVRTKDELLALIDDTLMGELLIPDDELPEGWREGFVAIAGRTRDAFINHPWTVDIPHGAEGGPNGTRHFEQSLEVASRTGLSLDEQMELISLVDDYAFGYALRLNRIIEELAGERAELAGKWAEVLAQRIGELDPAEFPRITAALGGGEPAEVLEELVEGGLAPERFERGLDLLLDGIEARIERYGTLGPG